MGEPRHAQACGVGISMKPHGTCLTNEGGSHTHSGLWGQTARAGSRALTEHPDQSTGLGLWGGPLVNRDLCCADLLAVHRAVDHPAFGLCMGPPRDSDP